MVIILILTGEIHSTSIMGWEWEWEWVWDLDMAWVMEVTLIMVWVVMEECTVTIMEAILVIMVMGVAIMEVVILAAYFMAADIMGHIRHIIVRIKLITVEMKGQAIFHPDGIVQLVVLAHQEETISLEELSELPREELPVPRL